MPESKDIVRYVNPRDVPGQVRKLSAYERGTLEMVNRGILACTSIESAVDFLFDATRGISPCDRIGLAFLEQSGKQVIADYMRARYKPILLKKGYTAELRSGSLRHVLSLRSVRIITDLQQYIAKRPDSASSRLMVREGVRSSMTCPLVVNGYVIGVLFRSSRRPHAYDDGQVLFHNTVGERFSKAIARLRQHRHVYYRPV